LLSNDDGWASPGLRAAREALAEDCDVVTIAPEHEQSASSHALSLRRPLRLRKIAEGQFALDGTPADCVYVALHGGRRVLPRSPDLVFSGINMGLNLGQDAFYSGTIAAAREAALRGVASIAASTSVSLDLAVVARASAKVARALLRRGAGRAGHTRLLSLNFPDRWDGRMRGTRLGTRIYDERVDFRVDPYQREYLWLGGPGVRHEKDPGTDTDAHDERVASITPLVLDLTCTADSPLAEAIAHEIEERSTP
jgi:5'-nucleotidase